MGTRGLLGVVALFAVACGSKGNSHSIEARWEARDVTDCSAPGLELKLFERDVLLRAGGYEARSDEGKARLLIPATDLGDADSVSVEIISEGSSDKLDLKLPERPPRSIEFPARPDAIDLPWSGRASLSVDDNDKGSYAWGAPADETGRLMFGLPCATVSATAEGGAFERVDGAPFIAVDVSESLRKAESLGGKVELNVKAELTFERFKGSMDFTGKYDVSRIIAARYGAIAAHPLDWAPGFEKGAKQGVVIVRGNKVDGALLKGGPADAALVAVVTAVEHEEKDCGPYHDEVGVEDVFLPRTRDDATITLYEAKTGTKVGETTLEAKLPRCPKTARGYRLDTDLGSDDRVVGSVPARQITRWIAKQR